MPSDVVGTVRTLERDSNVCSVARAGDNVAVTLQGVDGSHVFSGGVLCHPDFPVAIAKHLELKLLVLDGASPILVGAQVCIMTFLALYFLIVYWEKCQNYFFYICS
jgi:elongation factor 1 alpha-like protein